MGSGAGDRYSIEAFRTLFELHPELSEVIVEGRADAGIIRWFATQSRLQCDVFAVDDRVDVPSEVVRSFGLTVGNRSEVIALAASLEEESAELLHQVVCIADADFDYLLDNHPRHTLLINTDLATLEAHVISASALARFELLFLRSYSQVNVYKLAQNVLPAIVDMFVVRYILSREQDSPPMASRADSCVKVRGDEYRTDVPMLIQKCVSGLGFGSEEIGALVTDYDDLRSKADGDLRRFINWHDFVKVLIKLLDLKNDLAKPDVVERGLLSCLDYDDLSAQPLFRELAKRLRTHEARTGHG